MRAVFFSLLAINLGLFVWGQMPSSKRTDPYIQRQQEANFVGIPSFKLLGEMDGLEPNDGADDNQRQLLASNIALTQVAALRETSSIPAREVASIRKTASVRETASIPNRAGNRALCEMVGAFRSKRDAVEFVNRLNGIGIRSRQKDMVLPAGSGYWVYLAPSNTREKALRRLRRLQSDGIDSYVIPNGELANGISLGMFTQKNLSELRLQEMQEAGLDAKVQVIERTYREFWVMLDQGEQSKINQITWDRVLKGFDYVEKRQNFCLDVAS